MTKALTLFLVAAAAAAQQPRITNAKLETRSAAAGLEPQFQALVKAQSAPAWIGYAVPMVAGQGQMCCWSSENCCGGCSLEGEGTGAAVQQPANAGPVRLEGPDHLVVLFRVEQQRVEKIRNFSPDCALDAGGLPFYWLTDVRPAESIVVLASFATARENEPRERRRLSDRAVRSIALHADAAADKALEQFVAANQPEELRSRTTFWLGAARGRHGFEVLQRLLRDDPSERVREQAVFALSVSKQPEAVDAILGVARNDKSPHVRGRALFWLANKAGNKAAGAITDAIANDPDTAVKKQAVFALSRLPKDDSIRLLIQVARTNRNPVVRKQAMFWLGQSRDPRALDFFAEVLSH
ncbi:MAG TPA: HEAT repeat domain-containing protein [Bryobacterales bacterium]|nr:HEAT repeat domain-containing protein [Bryobacterales bacterium]